MLKPLRDLRRIGKCLADQIRQDGVKFDTVIVTGVSGLIIGPVVAYMMEKHICVIRSVTSRHSDCLIEQGHEIGDYIFIDDYLYPDTLAYVVDTVGKWPVWVYTYADNKPSLQTEKFYMHRNVRC